MKGLNNLQQIFSLRFLYRRQNVFAVTVFCKAIVVFVIMKILMEWSVSAAVLHLHGFDLSPSAIARILFLPAHFASENLTIFYLTSISFLIIILFLQWNYIIGCAFFWLMVNLFRLNHSTNNGTDYVLIMFAFWSIGMSLWPVLKDERLNTVLILLFNVSVFLCQLQIVFIYFVSGWDKLTSEAWRSGDALSYVIHIDYMFNQYWFGSPDDRFLNLTLSWVTILFELAFVVLVWIKRTRLIILAIGVVFHLIIWFALSLPDFGLVMILSYLVFLKDSDYYTFRKMLKLKPL